MQRFVQLFNELNVSNKTQDKLDALARYFRESSPLDAVWGLYFLTGKKLGAIASSKQLRAWVSEISDTPLWLVERSYEVAGDLAETLALLLPETQGETSADAPELAVSLSALVEETLMPLRERAEVSKFEELSQLWRRMDVDERFVLNKLITGGLRMGVSRTLVERGLAQGLGLPESLVTHRLIGDWEPTVETWERITDPTATALDLAQPYAFFLASPLEERSVPKEVDTEKDPLARLHDLGIIEDWQIEWKWDGIRAQVIRREGVVMLWSRGEERVHEMFPEITEAADSLPEGTVLDGEITTWDRERVGSFTSLQHRLGRKAVSASVREKYPCVFIAYDLLECAGKDMRETPLETRREMLDAVISEWEKSEIQNASNSTARNQKAAEQIDFFDTLEPVETECTVDYKIKCSETVSLASWEDAATLRAESRSRRVEGFMLKRKSSPYRGGRVKGDWWKWKIDPYTVDCVMLYAQAGHGRRAGLYTDFTFGVWDGEDLVPFTKAYSGLTNKEFKQVDSWIKKNTLSKRGPVRMVHPELVFEIAFENIHASKRHKAGLALRFPRIARWRQDKLAKEADTLESLQALIELSER